MLENIEVCKKLVTTVVRSTLKSPIQGFTEEDLIHEGMIALIKAERTFDKTKNVKFETYASRVIRNRLIDIARKWKLEELPEIEGITDDLENTVEKIEVTQVLEKILDSLNNTEQAIIGLYKRGLTYAQISKKLEIPEKKIDNTVQKVRTRLKKEY